MSSLSDLLTIYRQMYEYAEQTNAERAKIMASAEYQALQRPLTAMTAHLTDWSRPLAIQREEILAIMNAEGLKNVNGFRVKTRTSRSVDVRAVLEAMGGDIDNLLLVTSIKQKDLKEFMRANEDYKRDLQSCIREEGTKIVDVIPVGQTVAPKLTYKGRDKHSPLAV